MSTKATPAKAEKAEKPLTPAQTAKPFTGVSGTKQAAAVQTKKADAAAPEDAAVIAKDDPVKAIEKLEIRTKAVNENNVARVANSFLTSSDEKLTPLVSLKTGKPIEKFPATSKDLQKLGLTAVDAILNALDAVRTGGEEAKKERLRVQIGLKPNPA